MKVIVKLEISDDERAILADYIDGKQSKRLASRKDVNAFVQGCLDAALEPQGKNATEDELRALGHNDSYIRGWFQLDRLRERRLSASRA